MWDAKEREARVREIGREAVSSNLCRIVDNLRDGIAINHREIDNLIDFILEYGSDIVAQELESEIRQALFVLRANVSSAFNLASGGSDDGIRSAFNACHASEPILLALAARVQNESVKPKPPPELTDGQQEIIDVIRTTGKRLQTKDILNALPNSSEGTTKIYLAELMRRDILNNLRDSHGKGYGLPEWK